MQISFHTLRDLKDIKAVYPLMKELREGLTEADFLAVYEVACKENNYTLVAAKNENGDYIGLMGFRILTDYVHGRHLYIDDLVTTQTIRSQGIGAKLLKQADIIALEKNCKSLRLCTGIQNEGGKKFYEKNNWDFRSIVFKKKLSPAS